MKRMLEHVCTLKDTDEHITNMFNVDARSDSDSSDLLVTC